MFKEEFSKSGSIFLHWNDSRGNAYNLRISLSLSLTHTSFV